jgi:hypothetical protein
LILTGVSLKSNREQYSKSPFWIEAKHMTTIVPSPQPATVHHQPLDYAGTRRARLHFAPVLILWGLGLLLSGGAAAQKITALSGNATLSWTNYGW